jgi:Flp pilus assembly protein TadG
MNPPISATGKKPVTETSPARGVATPARGVATVEMALMLPFLLITMIGIIDVARAAFVSALPVANAASAGAFYGAQGPGYAVSTADILAAANADAQVSGMTITHSTYCECSDPSETSPNCAVTDCPASRRMDFIQVDTSADWVPIFNYPGVPTTVTLVGQAVVQVAE